MKHFCNICATASFLIEIKGYKFSTRESRCPKYGQAQNEIIEYLFGGNMYLLLTSSSNHVERIQAFLFFVLNLNLKSSSLSFQDLGTILDIWSDCNLDHM